MGDSPPTCYGCGVDYIHLDRVEHPQAGWEHPAPLCPWLRPTATVEEFRILFSATVGKLRDELAKVRQQFIELNEEYKDTDRERGSAREENSAPKARLARLEEEARYADRWRHSEGCARIVDPVRNQYVCDCGLVAIREAFREPVGKPGPMREGK